MPEQDPKRCVVGIGDLVVDVVAAIQDFPVRKDEFYFSGETNLNVGGRCNFLVQLSRLKVDAAAVDVIGNDHWGEFLCVTLRDEKVDTSLIQKDKDTSVSIVLADTQGSHSFIGRFSENAPYVVTDQFRSAISQASAVFASGYNFQNHNCAQLTLRSFELAKENLVIRGFDAGPLFHMLGLEQRENIYALVSHLFLNEEELAHLNIADLSYFFDFGIETVVIKKGAQGCTAVAKDNAVIACPGLKVPIVDTTAAGDCFDAGYIAGLIGGLAPEACAMLANCVGAAKVGKLGGGYNVPALNEIMDVMKRFDIPLEKFGDLIQ